MLIKSLFSNHSRIEILSDADNKLTAEDIEEGLEELDLVANSIVISGENDEIAVTRYETILKEEKIDEIKTYFDDKYGHDPSVSVVSPIVGQELVKNAIKALAIASLAMIVYVTFRFEFYFAITTIRS